MEILIIIFFNIIIYEVLHYIFFPTSHRLEIRKLKKKKQAQMSAFNICKNYYNKNKGRSPTKEERVIVIEYIKKLVKDNEDNLYSDNIREAILKNNALEDYEVFCAFFDEKEDLERYIKKYDNT